MAVPLSDSLGLIWSVLIGGIVGFVLYMVFVISRKRAPLVFTFREYASKRADFRDANDKPVYAPPSPPVSMFGWIKPTIAITEEDLLKKFGMDVVMLLRLLRACMLYFSFATLVTAIILYPVYGTGPNKDLPETDNAFVAGLGIISMSNLEKGSNRAYATWVVDTILVGALLYLMATEYKIFSKYRTYFRRLRIPQNYGLIVMDVPKKYRSDDKLYEVFNNAFPDEVVSASIVYDMKNVLKLKNEYEKDLLKLEIAEWKSVNKAEKGVPQHRPGCCKPKVDSIPHWESEMARLKAEIEAIQESKDKVATRSGLIVFKTRRAASTAAQIVFGRHAKEWHTAHAPDPKAVNWAKLSMHQSVATIMRIKSGLWLAFFVIAWAAVVTAVMAVANLTALSNIAAFSWLSFIQDLPAFIVGLIEKFLPVVFLIVLNMIPFIVMKAVAKKERLHSQYLVNARIRNYVYVLQVFSTYVYVLVAGSLLNNISDLADPDTWTNIDNLTALPAKIAQAVPSNGFFFINYVITVTLIGAHKELSQVSRVIVMWIFRKFLAKTDRALKKVDCTGKDFQYPSIYISASIVSLIGLSYSSIQPFLCVCVTLYFALTYLYTKYTLCFTKVNDFDDGGYLFRGAIKHIFVGLYSKIATMFFLMLLNSAFVPCGLELINLLVVIIFQNYLDKMYAPVVKFGSFKEYGKIVDEDEFETSVQVMEESKIEGSYNDVSKVMLLNDSVPIHYPDLYRHPGMKPLGEFVSQSGVQRTKKSSDVDLEAGHPTSSEDGPQPENVEPHRISVSSYKTAENPEVANKADAVVVEGQASV